jgi:hypothetical protein
MNDNSFEKPKDWGIAPTTSWVSGTPIGQDEVRMPDLGDPGGHENPSERVSFGDDDGPSGTPSLWQGKMVKQCPAGTSSKGGVCMPDPKSEATAETRAKVVSRQFDREAVKGEGKGSSADSFKREMPKAPEVDPQIRRITKEGYKGRNK